MKYTVHELANTKGTAESVRQALLTLELMVLNLLADKQELLEVTTQLIACHDEPTCPAVDVARAIVAKHKEKT